jgi:hypothetical protein
MTSNFDSWGGAFPGFLILNTKKIQGLSTQVKECGHQFVGADERLDEVMGFPPHP